MKYWAAMDNFSYSRIYINERLYRQYDRLLEGGDLGADRVPYRADEDGPRGQNSPFYIEELRPIQLTRFARQRYIGAIQVAAIRAAVRRYARALECNLIRID